MRQKKKMAKICVKYWSRWLSGRHVVYSLAIGTKQDSFTYEAVGVNSAASWEKICVIYPIKLAVSQKTCHAAKRIQRMGFLS